MCIGRSRSSKVVDFGTNRKGVCDFLLVINSNFGPILHLFWDTASYWLKIANFSYPTLVWRPRSGRTRQNFRMKLSAQKLEVWSYCMWKLHDPNFNRFWLIHPCDGRTDGQTDRQTDGRNCDSICALSIYTVARNKMAYGRLGERHLSDKFLLRWTTVRMFGYFGLGLEARVSRSWPSSC